MWPFGDDWGGIRQEVREYLKKEWKANVHTVPVEYPTLETTRNEARDILEVCYGHTNQ